MHFQNIMEFRIWPARYYLRGGMIEWTKSGCCKAWRRMVLLCICNTSLTSELAEAADGFGVQASWIPAGTAKTIHMLRIN